MTYTPDQDAAMRRYYHQRAVEYDQWYLREGRFADRPATPQWHSEVALLRERVGMFGAGHLLEIAAGTGWWTHHLARRSTVTAIDYAPAMLEQTAARLQAHHLQATLVRADAYHLPFANTSFDTCFFGFWLSHVPIQRQPAFFNELRRVIHPGGQILVIDSGIGDTGKPAAVEYLDKRTLNDGSQHTVLKILHTPETLAQALAPLGTIITAWQTGSFFVGAHIEVC